MSELETRAIELTGSSARDLAEALDQWENERQALVELYDENQALTIAFRRCDLSMTLAEQVIAVIEKDAGMFITQPTRDKIRQFRRQIQKLQSHRAQGREIVVNSAERRNAHPEAKS